MKQQIRFAAMLLAAALVAAACEKETPAPTGEGPETAKTVTISVSMPDELTKVALSQKAAGGMELVWEAGDQITVQQHGNTSTAQAFTLTSGAGDKKAEFTGTAVTGSSFDVIYTKAGSLTQAADGSTDHIGYSATLSGVSSYESVKFASDWASANGGTLIQSGVLHVKAKLPAGVAATVNAVTVKASKAIFGSADNISVAITTPGSADDILDVYAAIDGGSALAAGDWMTVQFGSTDAAHSVYTRYIPVDAAKTFAAGSENTLEINCVNTDKYAGLNDAGTATAPYLIADKYQLQAMHDFMADNTTKYFKLLCDIDMKDESWVALNVGEGFKKGIDFDGNNKTISNLAVSTGAYPSFVGVLNGSVKDLVFDGAVITGGSNCAGVLAGYIGSASASVSGTCSGITVNNSQVTGSKRGLGGLAGMVSVLSSPITDCHVNKTTVTSTADRVGGLAGQTEKTMDISSCSAENVTIQGSMNVGGLVGVLYGSASDCTSSGSVSSSNTTSNADIALGGLVGYLENGTISKCSSSVTINQTTNGRDIGGLVGKMLAATIEKSYATGNVKGIQRNVGGLVGLISLASDTATIKNSYSTGTVTANSYCGGFLGLQEKGKTVIQNCYAAGNVSATGGFAAGGMIGVAGSADFTMSNCAAWSASVTPKSYGASNWSSGAVVGVTSPKCTLTSNYRNPSMSLTAYWVPAADFNHPDVSSAHPLTDSTGAEMADTATASGQAHYPQYPYHGKVESGKTLLQLASTTLGWDSDVWDFSGSLPTLK